jgi:hypothetical protein
VRPFSRRLQQLAIGPAPALLVALWLTRASSRPSCRRLRPGRIEAAVESSLALPLSVAHLFGYLACYLRSARCCMPCCAGLILVGPARLFACSLAGRLLFVGQQLGPRKYLAMALALPLIAVLAIRNRYAGISAVPSRPASRCWSRVFGRRPEWLARLRSGYRSPNWPAGLADPGALPLPERLFLGIGLAWLALDDGTQRVPPLPLVDRPSPSRPSSCNNGFPDACRIPPTSLPC